MSIAVIANPDVADLLRKIGRRNNEIRKVVVSDSVTEDGSAPRTRTTTILRRADARQAVAELKDQPGEDILMFQSRTLWNELLVAGLVDELYLISAPPCSAGVRRPSTPGGSTRCGC